MIKDSKRRDELAESRGPAFLNNQPVYNARSNKLHRTAWHAFCHALWILYQTPNNDGEKSGNIEPMTERKGSILQKFNLKNKYCIKYKSQVR